MSTHDDALELRTPGLTVVVQRSHGAEIRHLGSPNGPNVLFWQDWSTPVRASRSISYGDSEADWLSEWRGGWQEMFPNAGATAEALGAPLAFHGEVSRSSWTVLNATPTDITLQTQSRLPFTLTRRMWLDAAQPVLHIEETVQNDSSLTVPFIWGHHPAFDAVPGTLLDVPASRAVVPEGYDVAHADLAPGEYQWPIADAKSGSSIDLRAVPDGPVERVVYLPDVASGWAALRRPDGVGVAMAWDAQVYRHMWLWTEIGGVDFPWYGRSRVMAVEPVSSWPNDGLTQALRRGRAQSLDPGAAVSTWLTIALFDSSDAAVVGVTREGKVRYASPE
jgi:galactose mutarotase-like enzyme